MAYKRILTMQDISCIGQCSVTVAMPILSACGHECCILPTAVLSTHTGGFGKQAVHHLGDDLERILAHWKGQGIDFDCILVGYLGSCEAVRRAETVVDTMLAPGGVVVVDPAMADHGRLYSGLDEAYAKAMGDLCRKADVMLPNITEACMMTGMPFAEQPDENFIRELLESLGGKTVILTGAGFSSDQTGAAVREAGNVRFIHHPKVGKSFHGTGDIFAACFTGAYMQGKSSVEAVKIAAEYTLRCIEETVAAPAHWYGVKFETVLPWLIKKLF